MKGVMLFLIGVAVFLVARSDTREIAVGDFRDRMEGAWIGQSVGVSYGWPTEFKWIGTLIPDEKMPEWREGMINETFNQDDLYVEMSFMEVLERFGIGVSTRTAGIEFANSRYRLWCANLNARNNLRNGIAAPASSHPKFNPTTDDIDYQIEADFSGILAPGLPQVAVDLGETFGRIMNYGDGLYAGQFVGALYANAYFEHDRVKIVQESLHAIPAESRYAQMVRDMLAWYRGNPVNWRCAWSNAVDRYWQKEGCRHVSNAQINVRVNGAMVLLGLLWGGGDMDRTMRISTAGGYDSDCNPSTACGVLGTILGAKRLAQYVKGLDRIRKWEFTNYDYGRLLDVSEKLARQFVVKYGGRVEAGGDGVERFVIPKTAIKASAFFDSSSPGPAPENGWMSDIERAMIRYSPCKAGAQSEEIIKSE